jgi:hypothetical protein
LCCAGVDKRRFDLVQHRLVGGLDRADVASRELCDRRIAAQNRFAVDEDRARATLLEHATLLRSGQPELVAQNVDQRRGGVGTYRVITTVHAKQQWGHQQELRNCMEFIRLVIRAGTE